MDRAQKHEFVADLSRRLSTAHSVVVAHYRGLSVAEMTKLRRNMADAGAEVQVVKNRLAKIAMAETPFAGINDMFKGPTILAYSPDAVATAKVAQKFADEHEHMVIVGGALDEKRLEPVDVKALSSMPSLDELRGKLVGLLQAPATKLAGVTQAPAGQLARLVAQKPENIAA